MPIALSCAKKTLSEIVSLQINFLLGGGGGGSENKNKISWVKCEDVCKDKTHRRLGIRDFDIFNQALLRSGFGDILLNQICYVEES